MALESLTAFRAILHLSSGQIQHNHNSLMHLPPDKLLVVCESGVGTLLQPDVHIPAVTFPNLSIFNNKDILEVCTPDQVVPNFFGTGEDL